jgi:hypothetical protein
MNLNKFLEQITEEDEVISALKKQGKAKNKPDSDFCPIELEIGIAVEHEHVKDEEASKEIAKDHLVENPHYYTTVLGAKEKEVMDKAEKIVKKHGYKSVEDYLKDSKKMKGESLNEEVHEGLPPGIIALWKDYRLGGGQCRNAWNFLDDITAFLKAKEISGRVIAKWDLTEGPESKKKKSGLK